MASEKNARFEKIIAKEAFLWGNDVAESYHNTATSHMDAQWNGIISPLLQRFPVDYRVCLDLAAGFGRNTSKLLESGAGKVIAVDINPDCIAQLQQKFLGKPVEIIKTEGVDLLGVLDNSVSLFYTFDAMVHFDVEIVQAYLKEAFRVLQPGGYGFIHHSNYSGNPGGDFTKNPHWRNFMSADLFKHISIKAGLEVVEQHVFAWGQPDIDCITIVRKPLGVTVPA